MATDVKTFDTFAAEILPQSDRWEFLDHWHVPGTHPPSGVPTREEAVGWLFVRAGQDTPPFWTATKSREWTTRDGQADVGYIAVTTTWTVKRTVEWEGRRYEHVGPLQAGPRFNPSVSYEVFKPAT